MTWNSVISGALPARGTPGHKAGRGVKYAQVVAAVKDCPESYNNLSVIVRKLQVIGFMKCLAAIFERKKNLDLLDFN